MKKAVFQIGQDKFTFYNLFAGKWIIIIIMIYKYKPLDNEQLKLLLFSSISKKFPIHLD